MGIEVEVDMTCSHCGRVMKVPRGIQTNVSRICTDCVKKEYQVGFKINKPVVVTQDREKDEACEVAENEDVPYINKDNGSTNN